MNLDFKRDPNLDLSEKNQEQFRRNAARFEEDLSAALSRCGRKRASIEPIVVTKGVPLSLFPLIHEAGYRKVGESRVLLAIQRKHELESRGVGSFEWHLIGALQKNKVGKALSSFSAIHSIDSIELAREIARRHIESGREALENRFFIQINPLLEKSKQGFSCDELLQSEDLIQELYGLLGNNIVGLMALAPMRSLHGDAIVHEAFSKVERLFYAIQEKQLFSGSQFKSLSMGMSQDFDIAVQYGATHIRIGSRIFQDLEFP